MIDSYASGQPADRRANSHRGRDGALREIESSGAAHHVRNHQGGERLIDTRANAVEQLHPDQPEGVIRQGIKRRTDRQDREGDEEDRPASPIVGVAPDENCNRQHDPLRGDHTEGHHRGRLLRELKGELLPDQRQERRVGEMEKKRAKGENHERTGLEENPVPRGPARRFTIGRKVSRPIMIDRFRRNREHCGRSQSGEDRNHEKDGALREQVADPAGKERNGDVAAVIVSRVAAEPPRQLVSRDEAEGQGRNGGSKSIARHREHAQGERHRPEVRGDEDDDRGNRHRGHRQDDDAALGARHVDRGADRGLEGYSEQSAGGCQKADIGLGPVLARNQKHIDERAEQIANVGGKEIDRVERIRDRNHRHQPRNGSVASPPFETRLSNLRSLKATPQFAAAHA